MKPSNLERQLQDWRAAKAHKSSGLAVSTDNRTLRVNGQQIVVVRRPKRTTDPSVGKD